VNRACGKSPGLRLAREQLVLLGPVKRQIQFGQTRRRQLDGLSALQNHQDQLRAQEGKVNETPDVAPANGATLGQILQRSGATGGESSNHPRPRAMALISAGSHLEAWFCGANPGSTSLVSAPLEIDSGRQLDRAAAWLLRRA
jgi:hypothetical protein